MQPRPDHGEKTYKGCNRLKGLKAVITGGDSGIGRAVAIANAREGADVLISFLNETEHASEVKELVGGPKVVCPSGRTPSMAAHRSRTIGQLSAKLTVEGRYLPPIDLPPVAQPPRIYGDMLPITMNDLIARSTSHQA